MEAEGQEAGLSDHGQAMQKARGTGIGTAGYIGFAMQGARRVELEVAFLFLEEFYE